MIMNLNMKNMIKSLLVSCMFIGIVPINQVSAAEGDDNVFVDTTEIQNMIDRANSEAVVFDKNAKSRSSYGKYPTRKGVILVTDDKYLDIIPLGHAAIIYTSTKVVESLADGVVTGNNDWNIARDQAYGITVTSTTSSQDAAAADYCYGKRGYPYNYNYTNVTPRNTFYCSQLVWAAYKDLYSIDLNTSAYGVAIHPMELYDTSLTSLIYRKK